MLSAKNGPGFARRIHKRAMSLRAAALCSLRLSQTENAKRELQNDCFSTRAHIINDEKNGKKVQSLTARSTNADSSCWMPET